MARAPGRLGTARLSWSVLESLLPAVGISRRWAGCRRLVDGVRWRVRTGVPWRDLPFEYGPWQTVYGLFRRSRRFISGCEPSACRRTDAPAAKDGPAVITEEGSISWHWRGAVCMGLHLP
ncbi:transposase [Streptomyces sp. CL12-4]|uniref:transposase n=1 Tax=Streptomyces sp. CL12-4 TaxID=2810306 RepID=UPI0027E2311D|nr:transposase [Streptomyces sp. CL12-4]